MTPELERKLDRIKNRRTKYEVVIAHKNHPSILLRYTSARSLRGIIRVVHECGEDVARLTGATTFERDGKSRSFVTDNGWVIQHSGRTQREAYINGERPFIGDLESLEYDPNEEAAPHA